MIQRSIATALLAALCWLSAPVTLRSPGAGIMHSARRNASPAQDHSCCPRPRARLAPVLLVAVRFPAVPCGAQHPCCVKQRPATPSSIPVQSKITRPAAEQLFSDPAENCSRDGSAIVKASLVCLLPPPFERSTVLRI